MNPIDLSAPFLALPSFNPPATTGTRSTKDVLDLLTTLHLDAALLAQVLAPFPVAGLASYSPQPAGVGAAATAATPAPTSTSTSTPAGGAPQTTVDIVADKGTPVIASAGGIVHAEGPDPSGAAIVLTAADGSQYRYAHLDHLAPQLADGRHVSQGDALGTVGGTGDAADPTRLVFGVQPAGGAAADPIPYLDRWLAQALASAQSLAKGKGTGPGGTGPGGPVYAPGLVKVKAGPFATSTPFDAALTGLVVVTACSLWWWNRRRRKRGEGSDELEADVESEPSPA